MKLKMEEKEIVIQALEILTDTYIDNDTPEDEGYTEEIEKVLAKIKGQKYIPIL